MIGAASGGTSVVPGRELTSRLGAGLRRRTPMAGAGLLAVVIAVLLVVPSLCFLVQAVSPRLFGQGSAWLTWANVTSAFQQNLGHAMLDTVGVSVGAAAFAVAVASGLAVAAERTDAWGRKFFLIGLWAVLLAPSYLVSVGWEEIVLPSGLLGAVGIHSTGLEHFILGPAGVALVLGCKGVPFAYFALAPSLGALGGDLEEAVRVHGGGHWRVVRTLGPVLAPALLAGFVIVFAESVGDFGVASTIAASSHFPVATYVLYESISTFPANFGVGAVVGWALVAAVGTALLAQHLLLRGRSFTVVTGRARAARRRQLTRRGQALACGFSGGFFALALGVPVLGVVSSSLLVPFKPIGLSAVTFSNYRGLLGIAGLGGPVRFSAEIALVCAVVTVTIGAVLARLLSRPQGGAARAVLDLALIVAVALPGVVFAAGYIFAFNLPIMGRLGLTLYGTVPLLGMAYVAVAVPQSSRILLGPLAQVQQTLLSAARVHGAPTVRAWRKGVLPLLARPLLWAALLAFSATFLELPVSELLSPPGVTPVSVAILRVLGKANIGQGTALSVVAVLFTLAVVALALGLFRLVTPAGWRVWQQAVPGAGAPEAAGGSGTAPADRPARVDVTDAAAGEIPAVAVAATAGRDS